MGTAALFTSAATFLVAVAATAFFRHQRQAAALLFF